MEQEAKNGIDDFIKKFGSDALLRRIRKPFAVIQSPEPENFKKEHHSRFLESLAFLLSFNEAEDIILQLNEDLKIPASTYTRKLTKHCRKFASNFPIPFMENTVCRLKLTEPMKETLFKINKRVQRIDNIFRNSNFKSFILIENNEFYFFSMPREISALFGNFFDFRTAKLDRRGFYVFDEIKLIPIDIMNSFLQSSENFRRIPVIEYSSNFPIIFKNKLIDSPKFNKICNFYYLGNKIKLKKDTTHLDKLLDSFPLESQIDKINLIGLLVSFLYIPYFPGQKPSIVVLGDKQDLGKTTLVLMLASIFTGDISKLAFLDFTDDEELKKQFCSYLKQIQFLCFDNLKKARGGVVSSAFVEKTITVPIFQERILGGNTTFEIKNHFLLAFTLNNGVFSDDILTRSIVVRLSSENEHKIKHNFDPISYTKLYRDEIIGEIANIALTSKKSEYELKSRRFKFKKWAHKIGSIMNGANFKGFLSNQDNLKVNSDPVLKAVEALLYNNELNSHKNYRAIEIINLMESTKCFDGIEDKHQQSVILGRKLSALVGTEIGYETKYQIKRINQSDKTSLYRFARVDAGEHGGIKPLDKELERDLILSENKSESNFTPNTPTQFSYDPTIFLTKEDK